MNHAAVMSGHVMTSLHTRLSVSMLNAVRQSLDVL